MRYLNRVLITLSAFALSACSGAPHSNGDAGDSGGATMAGSPASEVGESANVARDTAIIRKATTAFRSLDAAVAAGYPRSVASCLSQPQFGGMGYHHINRALLDDRIELERPEILLYSRAPGGEYVFNGGEYVFNGVEYIVPYSALPRDATPPMLMGQQLRRSDQLELWYLHAWVWTPNPAGLFADWNPRVECPS